MTREIERLPNFKFSKRMCTSLISQPWLSHQIIYNPTFCFRKCVVFNERKCQSLDCLSAKRKSGTNFNFSNKCVNVWQERLMNFTAESSSLDSVMDSEIISNQFELQGCVDKTINHVQKRCSTAESLETTLSSSVPMPYSLQKIFAAPSTDSSRRHSFDELLLDNLNESNLDCVPSAEISSKNNLGRTFLAHFSSISKQDNRSNMSTISSSYSFPSLLEIFDRRSSSSQSENERSSRRERRFSHSDSNNSGIAISSSTEANSPRESWYYYDPRLKPGTSFQVSSIADTLLEFFQRFHGSGDPSSPPDYDSSVAVDVSSSNSFSSILVPIESVMDVLSDERYSTGGSEFCSPPPYTERDEPPAYEEIDIHDHTNTYEIISTGANEEVTDFPYQDPPADQFDLVLDPPYVPQEGSDFNFGLSGRPAVRWNVQSRVERWTTASSLGWNQI